MLFPTFVRKIPPKSENKYFLEARMKHRSCLPQSQGQGVFWGPGCWGRSSWGQRERLFQRQGRSFREPQTAFPRAGDGCCSELGWGLTAHSRLSAAGPGRMELVFVLHKVGVSTRPKDTRFFSARLGSVPASHPGAVRLVDVNLSLTHFLVRLFPPPPFTS